MHFDFMPVGKTVYLKIFQEKQKIAVEFDANGFSDFYFIFIEYILDMYWKLFHTTNEIVKILKHVIIKMVIK